MDPIVTGSLINAGAGLLGAIFGGGGDKPMSAELLNRMRTQALRKYAGFAGLDPQTGYPIDEIPGGGMYSGVYTNPEEQSIINKGFRSQADTISAAARAKADALIAGGMDPERAKLLTDQWSIERGTTARLGGEADLMHSAIGERLNRLKDVWTMGNGGMPTAREQLAYTQANNANQAGLWDSIGDIIGSVVTASNKSTAPAGGGGGFAAKNWVTQPVVTGWGSLLWPMGG